MRNRLMSQKKGFTLIEVIVAVVIAATLTALAIPRFTGYMERVRASEGVQIITALLRAQIAYELETGGYDSSATCANLDVEFPNAANFNVPPACSNPADAIVNPIATITRIGGYRLQINELGTIWCINVGAIQCAEAGY